MSSLFLQWINSKYLNNSKHRSICDFRGDALGTWALLQCSACGGRGQSVELCLPLNLYVGSKDFMQAQACAAGAFIWWPRNTFSKSFPYWLSMKRLKFFSFLGFKEQLAEFITCCQLHLCFPLKIMLSSTFKESL